MMYSFLNRTIIRRPTPIHYTRAPTNHPFWTKFYLPEIKFQGIYLKNKLFSVWKNSSTSLNATPLLPLEICLGRGSLTGLPKVGNTPRPNSPSPPPKPVIDWPAAARIKVPDVTLSRFRSCERSESFIPLW